MSQAKPNPAKLSLRTDKLKFKKKVKIVLPSQRENDIISIKPRYKINQINLFFLFAL